LLIPEYKARTKASPGPGAGTSSALSSPCSLAVVQYAVAWIGFCEFVILLTNLAGRAGTAKVRRRVALYPAAVALRCTGMREGIGRGMRAVGIERAPVKRRGGFISYGLSLDCSGR
jgi:hypothetical protein